MANREVWIGFLTGAVTGLAVSLLYAPQSGAATRRHIRERSLEAGAQARDKLTDVKSSIEQSVTETARQLSSSAGRIATAIDKGRESFRDALAQG